MQRVESVHPLADYRLEVRFVDGTSGEISLGERLFGPIFEPLKDPQLFQQVFVDDFGAIAWPVPIWHRTHCMNNCKLPQSLPRKTEVSRL